jgi:hypothetical protein
VKLSRNQVFRECMLVVFVTSSVVFSWIITLMFMGILEEDTILEKFLTRPSVYEIGLNDDSK